MSYAAFKMVHSPTGVETCDSAFLTHSPGAGGFGAEILSQDVRSHLGKSYGSNRAPISPSGPLPNLVITKANVLEVYVVRCLEEEERSSNGGSAAAEPQSIPDGQPGRRSGNMEGIAAAWLELVCSYRLHGNVDSMAVLSNRQDEGRRRRDAIILAFREAKICVLEFDDSTQSLKTSSLHYFEGPEWQHLKRGRERFARGPLICAEPLGRCAGVLVFNCQMVVMRVAQVGYGLEDEDDSNSFYGASKSARVASTYVMNLRTLDIKHVKDFVFLRGYNEPVILVLHEVEPTWAGRVAVKRHTCSITALSINTALMQQTLFWSATSLPYDAYKLIAVPSPVEGVLVLCSNSLHYYNQSSSCVLAVNEFAVAPEGSPEFPKSNINVELDSAQVSWISHDVALLSTKNGNLLLLHLEYDGRIVHKLKLSKSRASVLASCMCMVGDNFFFLGSRLGDSLFVQFTQLESGAGSPPAKAGGREDMDDIESEVPNAKRQRTSLTDSQDAADELLLYSPEKLDISQKKTFGFAVRDSFVNVGPLRDFAQASRQGADSVAATGYAKQSDYELVCCSGHGKNGSISVLHQSIRPDLITDVNLPGCRGVWTVYSSPDDSDVTPVLEGTEYHAFLIICLETRTMVLETGETLGEVTEKVGYYTQGPTVMAGNLFGRRRIIQVHADGLLLLNATVVTQEMSVIRPSEGSKDAAIVHAAIGDPYVILQMNDGSAQLVKGFVDSLSLDISAPSVLQASDAGRITACSLFSDKLPGCWMRAVGDIEPLTQEAYQADVYCIVCRENGSLDILKLPELSCIFSVRKFTYGRAILSNELHMKQGAAAPGSNGKGDDDVDNEFLKEAGLVVTDVCMETWDRRFGRPFLFAILSDGTMLCYHAYSCEDVDGSTHKDAHQGGEKGASSKFRTLRFARLPVDWMSGDESSDLPGNAMSPKLVRFGNVRNLQGLFVTGDRPAWMVVYRERIRMHPHSSEGAILAFTPLHNVNCSHGLIYATNQGSLKVCQLNTLLNFDNDWPLLKVPLKSTPHQITHHADAGLYAVIISTLVTPSTLLNPTTQQYAADNAGDHQYDGTGGDDAAQQQADVSEEFEVRVIGPPKTGGLWETKGSLPMLPQENAVAIKIVTMKTTDQDQTQTLLAIGSAYPQGEDTPARGRITLVAIGGDASSASVSLTEVYSKEMKGSISAIAALQGNLLLAIGSKIILHTWNGSELNGAAFFDAPLYVVSLNIVKNFVLFGDIHKSIYFLSWKEEGAQLICLAKDFSSLDCFTTEFLIDGSTLSLIVSDSQKNIQIFSFAPKSVESWKGQKLLPRAEFHLGAHVSKFLRLQMHSRGGTGSRTNRFAVLFGTLDGSIDYLAPLDELTFRRLQTLQRKLLDVVAHVGGLNPRAFRQFQCGGIAHRPGPDNIVDCELLWHYTMLGLDEQVEIARQIGTTRTLILSNLRELSLSAPFL